MTFFFGCQLWWTLIRWWMIIAECDDILLSICHIKQDWWIVKKQHLIWKRGMEYHGYTPAICLSEGFSPARNFGMPSLQKVQGKQHYILWTCPSIQLRKHTWEVGGTSTSLAIMNLQWLRSSGRNMILNRWHLQVSWYNIFKQILETHNNPSDIRHLRPSPLSLLREKSTSLADLFSKTQLVHAV